MGNASPESNWKRSHTAAVVVIAVGMPLFGWLLAPVSRLFSWLLILVLMTLFIVIVGHGLTRRLSGLLIDPRNKMSLSRFQMILWTVIILSGYFAAALYNLSKIYDNPLAIALQPELWTLMGISTVSLIGSPLIKSSKEFKTPDAAQQEFALQRAAVQRGIDKQDLDSRGLLIVNKSIDKASLSDMFATEETGDAGHLDLGKVQMFFFTLVLALSYAVALAIMFDAPPDKILELPTLSQGMLALLGISNGGYLVNKATPRSKTADQ
jgi:hypothetical protein